MVGEERMSELGGEILVHGRHVEGMYVSEDVCMDVCLDVCCGLG